MSVRFLLEFLAGCSVGVRWMGKIEVGILDLKDVNDVLRKGRLKARLILQEGERRKPNGRN